MLRPAIKMGMIVIHMNYGEAYSHELFENRNNAVIIHWPCKVSELSCISPFHGVKGSDSGYSML